MKTLLYTLGVLSFTTTLFCPEEVMTAPRADPAALEDHVRSLSEHNEQMHAHENAIEKQRSMKKLSEGRASRLVTREALDHLGREARKRLKEDGKGYRSERSATSKAARKVSQLLDPVRSQHTVEVTETTLTKEQQREVTRSNAPTATKHAYDVVNSVDAQTQHLEPVTRAQRIIAEIHHELFEPDTARKLRSRIKKAIETEQHLAEKQEKNEVYRTFLQSVSHDIQSEITDVTLALKRANEGEETTTTANPLYKHTSESQAEGSKRNQNSRETTVNKDSVQQLKQRLSTLEQTQNMVELYRSITQDNYDSATEQQNTIDRRG